MNKPEVCLEPKHEDYLKRTKWILVTKSHHPLAEKLNEERVDDWAGKVGRIDSERNDVSIEPRPNEIVMFLQVGSGRTHALFGFGKIVETCRREEGDTPVNIRYLRPIFDWPFLDENKVQSFLRRRWFENSKLKKRLTKQPGSQGSLYLSLGDKDRLTIQEMFDKFKPVSQTQDEWNNLLLSLSADRRTKILREVEQRVGQDSVRNGAIKNYPKGCALCKPNISEPKLLVAAHIKPWSASSRVEKKDLTNVILLCAFHDKLFEAGYLTLSNDLSVLVSTKLSEMTQSIAERFTAKRLTGWIRFRPSVRYLSWHREFHAKMVPFN